jgi:hypothetical protein
VSDFADDQTPPESSVDGHEALSAGTAREDHRAEPTGDPAVDGVLASLEGLESRPLAEHVAVFEAAHDRLRAALADAGS